ncbi:response regulator [Methylocapsa polymorpha]|uniref:Response regulator n=1 Tax=Methylocapsa polymorpha TaxID=3080828 RepID=A0ABZ0HXK6_9HYPH|nr:response regulator [Methylocapsa sp. RX1]
MSTSQAISSHIPYLRRFARALTGSQASGDAYVVAALEAIVADPAHFDVGADARTALYRLFIHVWMSMPLNVHVDEIGFPYDELSAQRDLDAIALRPRIAFLLSSLEAFETTEVARTLECSVAEAAALIDAAGKEIGKQIRTDVLIIEDEAIIAMDLESLVEELGHHVVAVASTHLEAVAAAARERPGLILADIELADSSSGLAAVNEILDDCSVPVIFITAYPERFLTGAPPEPAFLVAKPFVVDGLKAAISQALFFDRKSHRVVKAEAASGLRNSLEPKSAAQASFN